MRKVELTMNEQNKYLIIKKLVESNGNKKRAAIKLGCTIRTVDRLILKYKNQGSAASFTATEAGPLLLPSLLISKTRSSAFTLMSILTQTLPISARSFGRI